MDTFYQKAKSDKASRISVQRPRRKFAWKNRKSSLLGHTERTVAITKKMKVKLMIIIYYNILYIHYT